MNNVFVAGGGLDDPDDITHTARHEAGHAVAATVLGLGLRFVDVRRRIEADGGISLGYTEITATLKDVIGKGESAALPVLIKIMAGPIAELAVNPDACRGVHHLDDKDCARQFAVAAVCETRIVDNKLAWTNLEERRRAVQIGALIEKAIGEAKRLVRTHDAAIAEVARLLLARESLTGPEVAEVVKHHPPNQSA